MSLDGKVALVTGSSQGIGQAIAVSDFYWGKKDFPYPMIPCSIYPRNDTPIQVMAHQCGTCRFGEDLNSSVLDLNCRTHEVENLYIVDGSFFSSSAAVNPTLTIIADALRVGDHLLDCLK